jgi:hypothetical protein
VTVYNHSGWTAGYLKSLLEPHNLGLTLAVLLGMSVGIFRRQRWAIIWAVSIVIFLGVMSASLRNPNEYYLLPIVPALWLLGGEAIVALANGHRSLLAGGLLCVTAVPLLATVQQNIEWSKPDTRMVAKEWIEANIRPDAKILMDGYQHRFVPSPPLRPDPSTIQRQISGASNGGLDYRGVSQRTLTLYAEAMGSVTGPTYELYSTGWGLAVKEPSYYVAHCFEYVITSSSITRRYEDPIQRQRFPQSARFYDILETDIRFHKIYSVEAIPWKRSGPTITIFRVMPSCRARAKHVTVEAKDLRH